MDNEKIIELYWGRCEDAIAKTALKYGGYCYTIAYNILSNKEDSEESVNDTWLAAWNTMPPRRPKLLAVFLGKMTHLDSIEDIAVRFSFSESKVASMLHRTRGKLRKMLEQEGNA